MKIRLVEPSYFMRTDRQTDRQTVGRTDRHEDMTKLIADFYNFANAHKIYT